MLAALANVGSLVARAEAATTGRSAAREMQNCARIGVMRASPGPEGIDSCGGGAGADLTHRIERCAMENPEVAQVFEEVVDLLEVQGPTHSGCAPIATRLAP